MPATSQDYPALSFQVRNDPEARSETVTIMEFTIHADGTLDDVTAIDSVDLYHDFGSRGKVDESDVLLGSGVFDADNGSIVFSFADTSVSLGLGAKTHFVVGVNLNGSASEGQNLRLGLQSRDDMSIVGA